MQPKRRLGEFLIHKKFITEEQLNVALLEQKKTSEFLGLVLIRMGMVSEETVTLALLASQMTVDFIHLKEIKVDLTALGRLPYKFAEHYGVFPVRLADSDLTVAMSNPLDIHAIDGLALATRLRIRPVLASEKEIREAIREYYGLGADTVDQMMTGRAVAQQSSQTVDSIDADESEASIGRFLNQLLLQAYREQATDIHIEPFEDEVRVRYRIDGVLYDAKAPENLRFFRDVLISRIKIMADLNIAEKRLPQDGRFRVQAEGQTIDLRVSFLPAALGESVVIRILNAARLYSLEELGFAKQEQEWLKKLIQKPYGIIFVTGPTGSGKTTTLYTCLSLVNKDDTKIITVEDPIEYRLRGITQIQAHSSIGLTFAATLRSMLRHDPDVMMVGEVRDPETAEIAIQAALTGHLVFSTLHTNDAAGGVTRLLDMGVEPYLVASAVEVFMAQRLVRVLCPKCRVGVKISSDIAEDFGLSLEDRETMVFEAVGCKECRMTGYKGRSVLVEFLIMDDDLRSLIVRRASASEIKAKAIAGGMRTLLEHGWLKVKAGITSPSEVLQVIN